LAGGGAVEITDSLNITDGNDGDDYDHDDCDDNSDHDVIYEFEGKKILKNLEKKILETNWPF